MTIERLLFALPQVLQEVVGLLAVQARQKNLTLEAHCDRAVPSQFNGDSGRVRQALLNLAGGITIAAQLNNGDPGFARFEITDTAIGITELAQICNSQVVTVRFFPRRTKNRPTLNVRNLRVDGALI